MCPRARTCASVNEDIHAHVCACKEARGQLPMSFLRYHHLAFMTGFLTGLKHTKQVG